MLHIEIYNNQVKQIDLIHSPAQSSIRNWSVSTLRSCQSLAIFSPAIRQNISPEQFELDISSEIIAFVVTDKVAKGRHSSV